MTIKTRAKKFLLGVPGFQALCRRLTRTHVRAVMYHRFSPIGTRHPRRLSAEPFASQLAYIARHHQVWSPDKQLAAQGRERFGSGGPPVVITVDDGYADFADVAFPLLQRHRLTATVFVTTEFVNGSTWLWWDRLAWLLDNSPNGERTFHFAGRQASGNPGDTASRWALWHAIADHLSVIGEDEKETALGDLAEQLAVAIPPTAPPDYKALTWDQVRDMFRQGIRFGAHTLTHPVLSRVDAERSEREIRDSGQHLARELGQPVDWFCYPQGRPSDFLPTTVEQVRQAGYRGSYTAYPDPHHAGDTMTLPRYSLSDDATGFRWIMCGAEYLFARWKW